MSISFDDLINPQLHPEYQPEPVFSDATTFEASEGQEKEEQSSLEIDPNRNPVVIVDNLHVKYQVYSSGKSVGNAGARRLLQTKMRGLRTVHALKGYRSSRTRTNRSALSGPTGLESPHFCELLQD